MTRIVQFAYTGGIVVYPEEGVSAFGYTLRDGAFLVGEYNGAQTDPTLADFAGSWPIPKDDPIQTVVQAWQLFDPNVGFTSAEFAAISGSAVALVIAALHALEQADEVDLTSPQFLALLQIFVDNALLTTNRRDEISAGLVL
jgi:hypothetical protein